MNRTLRAIAALACVVILVVGPPALLWAAGDLGGLRWAALVGVDDGRALVGVLTVVGWLAWGALVLSLVVEVVAIASRQRIRLRLPGLGWLQRGVAGLLLTIVALAPTLADADDGPAPNWTPSTLAPAIVEPPAHGTPQPSKPMSEAAAVVYRVEAGDDLWTLAESFYGDGSQWRRIAEANPTLLADGAVHLVPGWELTIPDAPISPPATVQVRTGDTLWDLAATHLGDPHRWPEIWRANADQITDPDEIEIGDILRLPNRTTGQGKPPAPKPIESAPVLPNAQQPVPPVVAPAPVVPARPVVPELPTVPVDDLGGEMVAEASVGDVVDGVLAAVGGLLAAGLTAEVGRRRLRQLQARPCGRRLPMPSRSGAAMFAALASIRREQGARLVESAQRLIADQCAATGMDVPRLRWAELTANRLELIVDGAMEPPAPFLLDGGSWVLVANATPPPEDDNGPLAWPTLVSLGRNEDAEILVDLASVGDLGCELDSPEADEAVLAGIVLQLTSTDVVIHLEATTDLVEALDNPRTTASALDDTLDALEVSAADQQGLGSADRRRRGGSESAIHVVILTSAPTAAQRRRLRALIGSSEQTVCVVRCLGPGAVSITGSAQRCVLEPYHLDFHAQQVSNAHRQAIAELLAVATSSDTTPAPWATLQPLRPGRSEESSHMIAPHTDTPTVLLLGPIDLVAAAGAEPTRARRSLIEYAAWLLQHPGATASQMRDGLFVAEGTRRSNISRLRAWLGRAGDGSAHLPEAYSQTVALGPAVTSDWERFQDLVVGSVQRASTDALRQALELVRGAPLADAAPNQWGWAEEMRLDMTSMIRDVGVTLARRALDDGAVDLARWAAARALGAVPDDELLLCERLRTEHRMGNAADVRRLAQRITARARLLGVDLNDETIDLLQEVLEGSARSRLS